MIDGQLDLRSGGGNLTADENGNILDLGQGGTGISGMEIVVRVPQASGTDTLVITAQHDDSATMASIDHESTFPSLAAAGHYRHRVFSTRRYLRLNYNVTDVDGGGVNFGVVEAYLTKGAASVGGARP